MSFHVGKIAPDFLLWQVFVCRCGNSCESGLTNAGWADQNPVRPDWGFFGVFLTVAELAVGQGLSFGVATRLAAVGGLLPPTPIWLMLIHTGGYLWE